MTHEHRGHQAHQLAQSGGRRRGDRSRQRTEKQDRKVRPRRPVVAGS
jgi:hypothetical protein